MNCNILLTPCITASKNWYRCDRIYLVPQGGIRQSLNIVPCMYHRVSPTGFPENTRLPWQQKLFEGRNLGRMVRSFEVLGVLIGKDPVSNKHTTVGQQSSKNKHLVFSFNLKPDIFCFLLNANLPSKQIFI